MQAHSIYISNLSPTTKDINIRGFFQGVSNVELEHDVHGNYLRSARVSFATQEALQQALTLSGTVLDGRPAILSVIEPNGARTSFYVHVSQLAPQAKHSHVFDHFDPSAMVKPVVVCVPMGQDNRTMGFAFVFLKALADFRSAVALDQTFICFKRITVTPGLFAGGMGCNGGA